MRPYGRSDANAALQVPGRCVRATLCASHYPSIILSLKVNSSNILEVPEEMLEGSLTSSEPSAVQRFNEHLHVDPVGSLLLKGCSQFRCSRCQLIINACVESECLCHECTLCGSSCRANHPANGGDHCITALNSTETHIVHTPAAKLFLCDLPNQATNGA